MFRFDEVGTKLDKYVPSSTVSLSADTAHVLKIDSSRKVEEGLSFASMGAAEAPVMHPADALCRAKPR